jgi:hypothetical protein
MTHQQATVEQCVHELLRLSNAGVDQVLNFFFNIDSWPDIIKKYLLSARSVHQQCTGSTELCPHDKATAAG